MAGERRRAYRQYGRAFRRTSRPFFPQPEGTRVFWPLAASLVAHGLFKPTSLLASGQEPKSPASRPRDNGVQTLMDFSFTEEQTLLRNSLSRYLAENYAFEDWRKFTRAPEGRD